MADNVNIEAKLCSYVEGDLDPAGRAEIEQYLESNPQYRPILEELVRTRGELRALPRVKAPVDLQENLSGQLERSALLGDPNLLREVGRRSRFLHARAWAAVLLLTAALAAVVYSVLPARKAQMTELANLTTSPADVAIATTAPASNAAETDAAANQTVAAMSAPLAPPSPATQLAVTQLESGQIQSPAEQSPATKPALNGTAIAQSVIVPAANLRAAEAQVHAYLHSQNYSFGSTSAKDAIASPSAIDDIVEPSLRAKPIGAPEIRMIVVHQLTDSQVRQTRQAMASITPDAAPPMSGFVEGSWTYRATPPAADGSANAVRVGPAKMFNEHGGASSPSSPVESDLAPGQTIHVTAEDTGLGGVTAMDENMTIDADGNLTLPLVGKVRAAGMPPAALSRSIALAYEIAKSPTRANWTIVPMPTTNLSILATQPSLAAAPEFQITANPAALPVTRPSTSVAIAQGGHDEAGQGGVSLMNASHLPPVAKATEPSTTAAIAASMPDEPRSDLTIVLVGTAPMATTAPSAPTTAPSTAPMQDGAASEPSTAQVVR